VEGVIAEHDAIKHDVGFLRQLVEKSAAVRDGAGGGGGWVLVLVLGVWVGRMVMLRGVSV
jgi:hypothetical protein